MDLDQAPRRPFWPWVAALLVALVAVGILFTQAQAIARDAERGSVTAPPPAPSVVSSLPADTGLPADAGASLVPTERRMPTGVAVDAQWSATTAGRIGIPERALRAYASAALTVQREQPSCGLGWNTLAGLGAIESAHGTHSGGVLRADGYPDPPIRGIALDGSASAAIPDTDGGRFDGDAAWDRAVGPLQFIPATWARWGADANGDGAADPNQIDDAALAAARYLCAAGEMTSAAGWRRAVFSYNHLDSYVDDVAAAANAFARQAG